MEKLKEWWEKLSSREKIALGVLVAGVVGYALYKRSKAGTASSSSAPNGGASVGQAVDSYGNPLYPTNLSGLYSQQPGGTFSTGTGPTASGQPLFPQEAVRSAATSPSALTYSFDTSHPGIPLTAAPGPLSASNQAQAYVPFGSQLTVTGPAVSGPVAPEGTSTYYPVLSNGKSYYINSYDLNPF